MKVIIKILSVVSLLGITSLSFAASNICTQNALNQVGDVGGAGAITCCNQTTDPAANQTKVCVAPASTYNFTMESFGFEKDDGTITQFGSTQTFNGASKNVNESFGSFVSGVTLENGTYVAIVPRVNRTFTVGRDTSVTTLGGTVCADITNTANNMKDVMDQPGGGSASLATCTANFVGDMCLEADGTTMRMRDNQLGTFTISDTSSVSINFNFDN